MLNKDQFQLILSLISWAGYRTVYNMYQSIASKAPVKGTSQDATCQLQTAQNIAYLEWNDLTDNNNPKYKGITAYYKYNLNPCTAGYTYIPTKILMPWF